MSSRLVELTIKEYSEKYGYSVAAVQKQLQRGMLADNGKTGKARRVVVELKSLSPGGARGDEFSEDEFLSLDDQPIEEVRRKLAIARTRKLEEESAEFRKRLFEEWGAAAYESFAESFLPLKSYLIEQHFAPEMADKINGIFDKCSSTWSEKLKTISQ